MPHDLLLCECSLHQQCYVYLELVVWSLHWSLLLEHIPCLAKKSLDATHSDGWALLSVVAPSLGATTLSAPDFIIGGKTAQQDRAMDLLSTAQVQHVVCSPITTSRSIPFTRTIGD